MNVLPQAQERPVTVDPSCAELVNVPLETIRSLKSEDEFDEFFMWVRAALKKVTKQILQQYAGGTDGSSLHEMLENTRMALSETVAKIKIVDAQDRDEKQVLLYRPEQANKVRDAAIDDGIALDLGGQRGLEIVESLMTRGIMHQAKIVLQAGLEPVLDPDGNKRLQLIYEQVYGNLKGLLRTVRRAKDPVTADLIRYIIEVETGVAA